MRVLRAPLTIVAVLSSLSATPMASVAPSPLPAPFLEADPAFAPMLYRGGRWRTGLAVDGRTATVLGDNPRAYATLELRYKGSSRGAVATFVDGVSGSVLDTVHFDDHGVDFTVRTIQLVARNVQVRISETGPSDLEVRVARVLLPKSQEGVANAIMPGLTPVRMYLRSSDGVTKELGLAGEAVALLQLAETGKTTGCTGFLASVDTVVTAAHCVRGLPGVVLDGKPSAGPCSAVGILFDLTGTGAGGAPVRALHCLDLQVSTRVASTKVSVPDGSIAGLRDFRADLADVAIMRIDPMLARLEDGAERRPLPLGDPRDDTLGSVVSHPQGGVGMVSRDCVVSSAGSSALVHKCSTSSGSSGAPVLQWSTHGWQVVGLHVCCSGTSPEDGSFEELRQSLSNWNLALPARSLGPFDRRPKNRHD